VSIAAGVHGNVATIYPIDYEDLVAQPRVGVERLGTFLGTTFGRDAATGAVRPELRRQKAK
jgi:hypothetical protein